MIAFLTFPVIAAVLVLLVGHKDSARDPRLTLTLLILLACYPMISALMPKLAFIPPMVNGSDTSGGFSWSHFGFTIWLLGSCVAAARLLLAQQTLQRWKTRSVLVQCMAGIEVRVHPDLTTPLATGILRKVIYVPPSWNKLPEADRAMILAHEITHHQRRDPWWKLFAELARVIHWFNPLVHWMARRLALQCEHACDADVVLQGADKSRYARLLCDCASSGRVPALAISMASQSTLEQRVRRIITPGRRPHGLIILSCVLLGAGCAFGLATISARQMTSLPDRNHDAKLRLTADPFPANR